MGWCWCGALICCIPCLWLDFLLLFLYRVVKPPSFPFLPWGIQHSAANSRIFMEVHWYLSLTSLAREKLMELKNVAIRFIVGSVYEGRLNFVIHIIGVIGV
jgi:hypothetical protein